MINFEDLEELEKVANRHRGGFAEIRVSEFQREANIWIIAISGFDHHLDDNGTGKRIPLAEITLGNPIQVQAAEIWLETGGVVSDILEEIGFEGKIIKKAVK